jgi:hypothetical protein
MRSTTPPIGFTQDNFEAVLNGTKTETRRLFTVKGMTQEKVKADFKNKWNSELREEFKP